MEWRDSIDSEHEGSRLSRDKGPLVKATLVNTLYEMTELAEYIARKIEPGDIPAIKLLLNDEDYTRFKFDDPVILFETCCFSVAIFDVIEADRLVAAAFFDDKPASPDLLQNVKKWKHLHDLKNLSAINTLHMRLFVSNPEVPVDISLAELISRTFAFSIHIEHIIVEMPDLKSTGPYVFNPLVKEIEISTVAKQKKKIIVYAKDLLFPHLVVREARKRDVFELAPILQLDSATMEQQFGRTHLRDVIFLSDKTSQSMIAEWRNAAVGMVSVSAEIDYDQLNRVFQLEPFNGLYKPHPLDEVYFEEGATKPVVDVEFDRLFQEAERTFQERGIRLYRRDESSNVPYDVEVLKEFGICDDGVSDDESTHADKVNDKPARPHQFTAKVSEDIIMYGLRTRSPIQDMDTLSERETGSGESEGRLSGSSHFGEFVEKIDLEEEDEEEGDEENEDNQGERAPSVDDFTMPASTAKVVVGPAGGGGEGEGTSVGGDTEAGEEMAGEEVEEGSEEGLSVIMDLIGDINEAAEEDVVQGDEEGEDGAEEIKGSELVSAASLAPTEKPQLPPINDSQSVDLIGPDSRLQQDSTVISPRQRSNSDTPSLTDSEGAFEASGFEEEASQLLPTVEPSRKLQSKTYFDARNIQQLQSLRPEVRRRMSEDTLFVGKRVPPRTFDQKVELFKKVWDVYNVLQDDGMTIEQAKDMLTPADADALEEAHLITNGSLLKYISALLPDDTKYPFERSVPRGRSLYHGTGNALAVKLFNTGKKFMVRHSDMLRDVFIKFPTREFLVVSVPIGQVEPNWLTNFVRVQSKAESGYARDLFLVSKTVLSSRVRVRQAMERDMVAVRGLLTTHLEKDKIFRDFLQSFTQSSGVPEMSCYVAEVKSEEGNPLIGIAMLSSDLDTVKYETNYELEKHTYYAVHDPGTHGYIHHFVIKPIFQRFSKLFLKEVMRLSEKNCVFHRIYPKCSDSKMVHHQSALTNMEDWVPVMPRKRIHYEHLNLTDTYDDERQPPPYVQDTRDPYALIHVGKKFVLEPKIILTKRIVFVGASTTTISCVEKLISSTYRSFKRLTIIDPFGLPGDLPRDEVRNEFFAMRIGGNKMSYDTDVEWVQRLGIHKWVQVVMGRVTNICTDTKCVIVNSEYVVPYDKLILAPGMQFQRLDCPEPEINDPNFLAFKKNTATAGISDNSVVKFNRDTPKPKNVFTINNEVEADIALEFMRKYRPFMKKKKVLIFGGGLKTYACTKALLEFGIPPDRIVLIGPPDSATEWERKSGYIMSSKVRGPMRKELETLGVFTVENYEFSHWEQCSISGLAKRTHFKSLTERDAHISFSTFAVFCYRYKRVDDGLVSALSEAYILYQDGIVIDGNFKTNDPNIYAGGPAAVYQKVLLSDNQNHVYFQSEEIGHKLAELIVDSSDTDSGDRGKLEDFNVVRFHKPLTRAIKLLGGWHYLYLRSPGSHSRCSDFYGSTCEEVCECTTEVVTGSINEKEDSTQRFFKIRLDDRSRIVSLECMSKSPFSFSNMSALYGQHEAILNKMMERLEKGETTCLYSHFCQSWFTVFCIDEWTTFVNELRDLYKFHDIGDGITLAEFIRDFIHNIDNPEALQMDPNIIRSVWRSSGLQGIVEEKLLNFLKFHRLSLPMYANHNYVEDLLEERSTSTLYYPNTKAHMIQ